MKDSYGKAIEDQAIKAGIEDSTNEFRQFAEICLHKSIQMQCEMLARAQDSLVSLLAGQEQCYAWKLSMSLGLFVEELEYSPSLLTIFYNSDTTCPDYDPKYPSY